MKKLILASVLVVVAALFTACGGAGSPGGSENSGGGGSGSGNGGGNSSGGNTTRRTISTTPTSSWANFNFDLFDETELTTDMESGQYRYTIPDGTWKATYQSSYNDTRYYDYYEFDIPSENSSGVTITKKVRITKETLTADEIEELYTMSDYNFNYWWVPTPDIAESTDYYLEDGNVWVKLWVYNGADLNQNQGSITKEMTKVGTPKRNSDTTKIYDEGETITYYFEKVQTQ